MKLIKTEKYKVKIENPWLTKGEVFNKDVIGGDVEDYPEVFQELYQFEGLEEYYCLGDVLWRVVTKNYIDTVKSVGFSLTHLDQNIEIFPTKELAEEFLAQKENKRTERYSQSSIYNCLEYIALFSNKDIDKLTIKEIKDDLVVINNQANHALNQLKDENI